MDRQTAPHRVIADLAQASYGVVDRSRLLAAGVSATVIDHRIAAGVLIPVHRGVYAVGHAHLLREGRWLAAVQAVSNAVLSHDHAAALWELIPEASARRVHVTLVGRAGRVRHRGIQIHRPRRLEGGDVMVYRGIPVTTVARTLLDLAITVRGRHLEHAIRGASRARRFDLVEMDAVLARYPHHRGRRELARVLASCVGRGTEDFRSFLEVSFLQLCDDHGIPHPVVNGHVLGERVDFHWREARLVVETDSFQWHTTPTTFADDRRRDQLLVMAGFRVVRFTYGEVLHEPHRVAATVASLLQPGASASTPGSGAA